jgi:hypothetical protein
MNNTYTALATCIIQSEEWASSPTGTPVEAAFSIALVDKTWEPLESQLRIKILSETWPYLLKHASAQIDDDTCSCPDELFDSMLHFARDQYAQRVWNEISGVFTEKLSKVASGTFRVGMSFQLKKQFPSRYPFALEVGPLTLPRTKEYSGGVIPLTPVSIEGELTDDVELEIEIEA